MSDFVSAYHAILCSEFPDFLEKFSSLPILTRLKGVGLLCGTDWTPLYSNRFFYTRFDHSIGAALIAWNFTHDKIQTLASLFHDVATPAFSHVSDFRKGDALKQETTEEKTVSILEESGELRRLLEKEQIPLQRIADYHRYPICDNEIPRLSSDRLEYMFPSGMAFADKIDSKKVWTLDSVKSTYENIVVLKNEEEIDELGFSDAEIAEDYCIKFNEVGLLLQKNENKIALNLLGEILNGAEEKDCFSSNEFYALSEKALIEKFGSYAQSHPDERFSVLFRTFRAMEKIERSEKPLDGHYNLSLSVKKRRIDPLVKMNNRSVRISEISERAAESIETVLCFEDSKFGCVRLR